MAEELLFVEHEIPQNLHDAYTTDSPDNRLLRLARLNVFIGPNNAGKSRLLRALFADREGKKVHSSEVSQRASAALAELRRIASVKGAVEEFRQEVLKPWVTAYDGGGNRHGVEPPHTLSRYIEAWRGFDRGRANAMAQAEGIEVPELRHRMIQLAGQIDTYRSRKHENDAHVRIYIPTLRGLRPPVNEPFYFRQRTLDEYFSGVSWLSGEKKETRLLKDLSIFTGLEIYGALQSYLLGPLDQREEVKAFEQFLSNAFFKGEPVALIPRIAEKALHIKVGNAKEQPVWLLGDGIQQLIILTLPIFLAQKPLLLFVEEPELYLHPGFQRIWIDTVLNWSRPLQVFVVTHSHQFMDITIDSKKCSIYKVTSSLDEDGGRERESKHHVQFTSHSDFTVLLDLGVRNSSVLLSNCTIWVEGITDRLYLRRYLELVQHEKGTAYLEDLHYSFVEYGGSAITHFSFLDEETGIKVERLCGKLFLVADQDVKKKREARHTKLRESLGERCHILAGREIENLLTPQVLRKVVLSYGEDDANLATKVAHKSYLTSPLGQFIETKLLIGPSKRKGPSPYAEKSGTIKNKVDFCQRALPFIESQNDMSRQAIELTEAILKHIANHNP